VVVVVVCSSLAAAKGAVLTSLHCRHLHSTTSRAAGRLLAAF
jgi:hypothetical protein